MPRHSIWSKVIDHPEELVKLARSHGYGIEETTEGWRIKHPTTGRFTHVHRHPPSGGRSKGRQNQLAQLRRLGFVPSTQTVVEHESPKGLEVDDYVMARANHDDQEVVTPTTPPEPAPTAPPLDPTAVALALLEEVLRRNAEPKIDSAAVESLRVRVERLHKERDQAVSKLAEAVDLLKKDQEESAQLRAQLKAAKDEAMQWAEEASAESTRADRADAQVQWWKQQMGQYSIEVRDRVSEQLQKAMSAMAPTPPVRAAFGPDSEQ